MPCLLHDVPLLLAGHRGRGGKTRAQRVPAELLGRKIVRKYLRVKSFDESGQALLSSAVRLAVGRMEDLADIINVAIEELIRQSFELPWFTTLLREAQRGRAEVTERSTGESRMQSGRKAEAR